MYYCVCTPLVRSPYIRWLIKQSEIQLFYCGFVKFHNNWTCFKNYSDLPYPLLGLSNIGIIQLAKTDKMFQDNCCIIMWPATRILYLHSLKSQVTPFDLRDPSLRKQPIFNYPIQHYLDDDGMMMTMMIIIIIWLLLRSASAVDFWR